MKRRLILIIWIGIIMGVHPINAQSLDQIPRLQKVAKRLLDKNRDSCFKLLKITHNEIKSTEDSELKTKYTAYNDIMWAYLIVGHWNTNKEVDSLTENALHYFIVHKDHYGLSKAYQVLNYRKQSDGNFKKALIYNKQSLDEALKTLDNSLIALMYYDRSALYERNANFSKASENAFYALKYAELGKDSLTISLAQYILGVINYDLKDFNQAESYFRKSITYGSGSIDPTYLGAYCQYYAEVLRKTGKDLESAKFYKKALVQAVNNGETCNALSAFTGLGKAMMKNGQWIEAAGFFEKSRKIASETVIPAPVYFLNLAKINVLLKNGDEAIKWLNRFLENGNLSKLIPENIDYINDIAFVYEKTGYPEKALAYYKKWSHAKDSLQTNDSRIKLVELERRYEVEKRDAKIASQNLALAKSNNQRLWLGGLLIIVLIAGIAIIFILRTRSQKAQEKLKLQMKENQLHQTLLAQEEERKRLARELHDGIGQSLAALKMQLQMADDNKTSKQTIKSVDALCKEVRSLSHQMMPLVLQENGLKEALDWLINQSFNGSEINVDFVSHGFESRLNNFVEVHLYRIAQELINNLIRHSEATEVGIQLLQRNEKLIFIIEDNGIGFEFENVSGGIGLANINSRLESLGGKIEIHSEEGQGTFIRISIPLDAKHKMSA